MRISRALTVACVIALGSLTACTASSGSTGVAGSRAPSHTIPPVERRDVPYVDDGTAAHRLDLFLPQAAAVRPYPLVIFIHGGGWRRGDKSGFSSSQMGLDEYKAMLAANGYAAASINYRLSGDATFPANIHDVKAAVRYLRANAAGLGVDPDRFAVMGESAGGHLALLLGMSSGDAELEGELGTVGVSSAVQAVVSYYGFSDLRVRSQQLADSGCTDGGQAVTSEGLMLGAEPGTDQGRLLAALASPITHLDPADPPTLLFHGTQDCTAPTAQSKDLAAALEAAGVPTELRLIQAGHADAAFFVTPDLQQQALRFLGAHLAGR